MHRHWNSHGPLEKGARRIVLAVIAAHLLAGVLVPPRIARAGHRLFVELAFLELPPGVEAASLATDLKMLARPREPVSFGVPIPRETDLRVVDDLVLVGLDRAQFRITGRWPDGSARWLRIDTLVDLDRGPIRTDIQLTTGERRGARGQDLAERSPGGAITVDTGTARFGIASDGPGLLSTVTHGQDPILVGDDGIALALAEGDRPDVAIEPSRVKAFPPTMTLEDNGPLRASVHRRRSVLIDTDRQIDLSVRSDFLWATGQMRTTVTFSAPAHNAGPITLAGARWPLRTRLTRPVCAVDENGRLRRQQLGAGQTLVVTSDTGPLLYLGARAEEGTITAAIRRATGAPPAGVTLEGSGRLTLDLIRAPTTLAPGGHVRVDLLVDFVATGTPPRDLALRHAFPIVGRVASVASLNDARALADRLVAAPPDASASRASGGDTLLARVERALQLPPEAARAAWRDTSAVVERIARNPSFGDDASDTHAALLWSRLTADPSLEALCATALRRRAALIESADRPRAPADEEILLLTDLASLGEARAAELAWRIVATRLLSSASEGIDRTRGFVPTTLTEDGARRVIETETIGAALPRALHWLLIQIPEDAGAELRADLIRDILEGISRFGAGELWQKDRDGRGGGPGWPEAVTAARIGSLRARPAGGPDMPVGDWLLWLGHRFTGDRELLRRADALLTEADAIHPPWDQPPARQTLREVLTALDAESDWRPLEITVERTPGAPAATVSWTTPINALLFRLKMSEQTIVPWLGHDPETGTFAHDPATHVPFFAARNVTGEPVPADPGTVQSVTINGLPKSLGDLHVAARYLHRGPKQIVEHTARTVSPDSLEPLPLHGTMAWTEDPDLATVITAADREVSDDDARDEAAPARPGRLVLLAALLGAAIAALVIVVLARRRGRRA